MENQYSGNNTGNADVENPLQYWRSRILYFTLLATVISGFIAYVPSVYLAYKHRFWFIIAVDTAVLGWIILLFIKPFSYHAKALNLLLAFFLLGAFLLVGLGPLGAGYFWLFSSSIMTSVLLGFRLALISLLMNSVVLFSVGMFVIYGRINWEIQYSVANLLIIDINFISLNVISVVAIAFLTSGIEKAFEKEKIVNEKLLSEQEKLQLSILQKNIEVAERFKAEELLTESEAKYRSIVENSHDGILLIDQTHRICYANQELCNIVELPLRDVIGNDFRAILNSESFNMIVDFYNSRQAGESTPSRYEFNIITKNGNTKRLEISASIIRDHTGATKTIGQFLDVTEKWRDQQDKKVLQEQLLQSQKMESIGTLAGGIAHDFNNILGAITGYTQLIEHDFSDDDKVMHYVTQMGIASERATELVKQILAFSRQNKFEKKVVDPASVVKEVLPLLRASMPSSIEIRHRIDAGKEVILADHTQIHQVIMNLCTNAFHAMEKDGGVLDLSLEVVDITAEIAKMYQEVSPGRYMQLQVSDTGAGIDAAIIQRIYDPYFTTKETGKGTGLGLATVHGIVRHHGGDITVRADSAGTVFTVILPLSESRPEPKRVTPILASGGDERVLFVDDEVILTDIGKKILNNAGYSVEISSNPVEALDIFREKPGSFDIVISDMTMPGLSGDKLAAEIKKIRRDIPVILCTGFIEPKISEKTRESGIDALLLKPVSAGELTGKVRNVLDAFSAKPL